MHVTQSSSTLVQSAAAEIRRGKKKKERKKGRKKERKKEKKEDRNHRGKI